MRADGSGIGRMLQSLPVITTRRTSSMNSRNSPECLPPSFHRLALPHTSARNPPCRFRPGCPFFPIIAREQSARMRSHENTTCCRTDDDWPSVRPKRAANKGWLENENHRFDLRTGNRTVSEILGGPAWLHKDGGSAGRRQARLRHSREGRRGADDSIHGEHGEGQQRDG